MAEGSVEEDSGDMLGPTAAPILQTSTPSNMSVKDEVILFSQTLEHLIHKNKACVEWVIIMK